jgi:hypothetical protein
MPAVIDPALRFAESVQLLRALSGPHGIHASLASTANYRAVFARDAVMAGIAGLLVGDRAITTAFVRTLDTLRDLQGPEGQIASNFAIADDAPPNVSFGTLAPRIDAAAWYLVGVAIAGRAGVLEASAHEASVRRTVAVLNALEYNGRQLVYVPTGGNWADEYVYEGYVLYDQVLRAWGLRLVGTLYGEPQWVTKSASIDARIEEAYTPRTDDALAHPIAAFTPTRTFAMFDLAACGLLAVSHVAPSLSMAALDWIEAHYLRRDALPPAFAPVIEEHHADWPALRAYHLHAFRNRPHEYHNGGIWPIWLGWLALGLARSGRDAALERLRAIVRTRLGDLPDFAFEEFLHGVTGAAGGTPNMAYTASGLIFLELAGSDAHRTLLAP